MNAISIPTQVLPAGRVLPSCPYQGLMPYTEEDAEFFFGRDRDTRLIIDNFKAYRVTVLYGPSGVGKSSVLRAGVLQRMNEAEVESLATFGLREALVVYCNNWRDDPLAALADQVHKDVSEVFPDRAFAVPERLDAPSLADLCELLNIDIYLVLDQFEEYFVYHADDPPDGDFARELAGIIASAVRVNLLIAIREDALARLDRFEGHVPRLFDNTLRLDHLDRESAREAVLLPLQRYNELVSPAERMEIDPELVDPILDQTQAGRVRVGARSEAEAEDAAETYPDSRIEAPFLQLVLTRLWWEERARHSSLLHPGTLRELGGAERIVSDHLDLVLNRLGPDDKALAAAAFRYLVTASGTKFAYTPTDLAESIGADKVQVRRLLQLLSTGDQRILRDVRPPLDNSLALQTDRESQYEFFHDVLALAARDWRRRYDAEQAEEQQREAQERLISDKQAADNAAADARRRLRRSRVLSGALALVVVLCLILAVAAVKSRSVAAEKQTEAEQTAALAESAKLLRTNPEAAAAAALRALRQGGGPAAQEALRAALSQPRPAMTMTTDAGSGAVWSAEMSPREDLIVAAYHDGTVRLWDAHDGHLRQTLDAGKASGRSATKARFSRDGSLVVTSSDDGRARVFDARDGSLLHELGQYENPVIAIPGVAGQRTIVFTWAVNENPAIWDATTGKMLATLDTRVRAAALSDDGTRVAIGSYDGRLRVWTWAGKGQVVVDPHDPYTDFTDVAFGAHDQDMVLSLDQGTGNLVAWNVKTKKSSRVFEENWFRDEPDGISQGPGQVIAVYGGKEVAILDSTTGDLSQMLPDGDDYVNTLAFNPDGRLVARGDNDGTIRVFPVQSGSLKSAPLWVLLGHPGAVQSLAFSRDGGTLLSAAADGSVRTWRLPERLPARSTSRAVSDARFSADGRIIASGDSDEITTFDAEGRHPRSFAWPGGATEQLRSLAVSPDGSEVVVITSEADAPRVFELSSGKEKLIPFNGQSVYYLSLVDYNPNPTHPWIAVGDAGGGVEMLDVSSGDLLWSERASDTIYPVFDVHFSADGSKLATASTDGVVKLFDAASGRELRVIHHSTPVSAIALTTDGAYLASYAEDRKLRVWSMEESRTEPVAEVAMPVRGNSLIFSPDPSSNFLAVAGSDGMTMVYQWQKTLKPLATIRQHSGSVNAVQFDPNQPADGSPRLMSASDDGTVVLYSCALCSIQGGNELRLYASGQLGS